MFAPSLDEDGFSPPPCQPIELHCPLASGLQLTDRQEHLTGWDQQRLAKSTVAVVGLGGLGCASAQLLVRAGIGELLLIDHDVVSWTDLAKTFYHESQVGSAKAQAAAAHLAGSGFLGTKVRGFPMRLCEFLRQHTTLVPDLVLACTDNDASRLEACRWCLSVERPLLAMGVSGDGTSQGYVFVQEKSCACLACYFGERMVNNRKRPCPGTPMALDILHVMGGLAFFATTSVLMGRERSWNCVRICLAKGQSTAVRVPQRATCLVCGTTVEGHDEEAPAA